MMNYSTDQLDIAINSTGLPENHCTSLRSLVATRKRPMFLGYVGKTAGVFLLALAGYCMYLMVQVISKDPDLQTGDLRKVAHSLGTTGGMCFVLALFVIEGASEYLKRIRQSRAVCELLMTRQEVNPQLKATAKSVA